MLIVVLKLILTASFFVVFLQDHKARQVYWFLFPIIGSIGAFLFYQSTLPELFFTALTINLGFVMVLTLILLLYAKLKLKTSLFNTIGLGDILLFLAISISFSSIPFVILFVSALIFSLILHLCLNRSPKKGTVPLAGYMAIFFSAIYIGFWSGIIDSLYLV